MRVVRFTLWQIALVVVLVLAPVVAVLAAIQRLVPAWQLPWLIWLLCFTAIDAVATQRVVVRQRLVLAEQLPVRGVEWTLLIVATRLVSVAAENDSLLAAMEPWLRDPLLFFGGRFVEYLAPVVITWGLAASLAQVVLGLEAELPKPDARRQSIDDAMVREDRAHALAAFDQLWIACLFLTLGCAAFVLYQVPLAAMLQSWTSARLLLAVFGCISAGLFLHSRGHLDQLNYGWQLEQTVVDADVPRRWRRGSWLITGTACVVGLLLGSFVVLAPPPPLVPVANALLFVMAMVVALMIGLVSLLLLPFAWLLSLLTDGVAPTAPRIPPITPPQITTGTPDRPLLPALIFWGCVLFLLGIAVLRYVQQRQDLASLIQRWPALRWLLRIFGTAWQDVQAWSRLAAAMVRQRLRRRTRVVPRGTRVHGARAQLREIYERLVTVAERKGLPRSPTRTPYELSTALRDTLPSADAELQGLTDVYVAAEYGPGQPQAQDVRRARSYWRRIKPRLGRSGGVRRSRPTR